jgi:hypothetical protein
MIIFIICSEPEPDPILFSDLVPLRQIISDPGGSGSGSTMLQLRSLDVPLCTVRSLSIKNFYMRTGKFRGPKSVSKKAFSSCQNPAGDGQFCQIKNFHR